MFSSKKILKLKYIHHYFCFKLLTKKSRCVLWTGKYDICNPICCTSLPSYSDKAKRLFSQTSRLPLGLAQPHIQWVPGFLPGLKLLERNVYHSRSCNAEVKNDWTHHIYSETPYNFVASAENTSLGNVEEIDSNFYNGNR